MTSRERSFERDPEGILGPGAGAGATGDQDVDMLVQDIEVTRLEMTGTVEEIGDRLDPKNIVAGAREGLRDATIGKVEQMANDASAMVGGVGESARQAGSGLTDAISRNPVPAAMVGIGLAWLAMSMRSTSNGGTWSDGGRGGSFMGSGRPPGPWESSRMGVGGGVGSAVDEARRRSSDAMTGIQDRAGRLADDVGQTASQAPQQVQATASQAGDQVGRIVQENPLGAGMVAFAVGAAVGMAIPATSTERRMAAGPAEQALRQVETAASDALEQAETTARDAEQQAREQDRRLGGQGG